MIISFPIHSISRETILSYPFLPGVSIVWIQWKLDLFLVCNTTTFLDFSSLPLFEVSYFLVSHFLCFAYSQVHQDMYSQELIETEYSELRFWELVYLKTLLSFLQPQLIICLSTQCWAGNHFTLESRNFVLFRYLVAMYKSDQVWGLCSVLKCFLIAFQSIFSSGILILWWCSMVKSCSAVPFNLFVHKQSGKPVCVIYFRVFILTILFSQARIHLTWKLSTINCHPFSSLFDFTFICFKIFWVILQAFQNRFCNNIFNTKQLLFSGCF